jgi:mannosyltransferase
MRTLLWRLVPLALAAAGVGLAAPRLRRSLTLDETEHIAAARHAWSELVPFHDAAASGSPYHLLLKAWLHVGTSEWVVRLPSVAAIALSAMVVYAVGARVIGREAGAAAGLLFVAGSPVVDASQLAGPLALALLVSLVATWLLVVALETDNVAAWTGYAVAAPLSVWSHASCAAVVVAHGVTVVSRAGFWSRRTGVVALLVVLAALAPIVDSLDGARHRIDPRPQPDLGDVGLALHDASGRNVALLALAAAGVAGYLLRRVPRAEPWRVTLLTSWAVAPLLASLVLSVASPSLDPRYLLASTPALALLGAAALSASPWREVAVTALAATLVPAGYRTVELERKTEENWRAAATYALAAKDPLDRVVVAPARAITAFAYYAGPDRGSTTAGGTTVFVLVRATDQEAALDAARDAVRVPAYALRDVRRFGTHVFVQRWERTGLPPGS